MRNTVISLLFIVSGALVAGCTTATEDDVLGVSEDLLSGTFEMEIMHSGSCVDVEGVSLSNGAEVHQWSCHGGANQQWVAVDRGNGYHSFRSVHSGKCMDIYGGSSVMTNGAKIVQWTCHDGYNQQFKLIPQ